MGFASKEQLQELMQYMGENIHVPQLVQHFDGENIYSTDERIVGCWIDGRPIYQKTVNFGKAAGNNSTRKVAHNIQNISKIIKNEWFGTDGSSSWNFPWTNTGTDLPVNTYVSPTEIVMINGSGTGTTISTGNDIYYVTLQYTKTTDAANSFNIAKENDYSTTERVVGTWIDGKPIYQKVIPVTGGLTAKTTKTVAHNINNYGLTIKCYATITSPSNVGWMVPFADGAGQTSAMKSYEVWVSPDGASIVSTDSVDSNHKIFIFLQYTKTTD